MDMRAYIDADPAVSKAKMKLNSLRCAVNSRWGESRRFAGRMASNNLDKIERAQHAWSRAYDRAEARFHKQHPMTAA